MPYSVSSVLAKDPADPGQPYLMIDLYPWDLDNPATLQLDDPDWARIFSNPEVVAVVLKTTDGLLYNDSGWFNRNFRAITKLFGGDRGVDRFAGGYHFHQFLIDGVKQGDFYVDALQKAGHRVDDIVPIVDVESGGERHPNRKATHQQIVQNVSSFVERVKALTGRSVMLYGRNTMWEFNITTRFGCDRVWNPSFTRYMDSRGLTWNHPVGFGGPWALSDIKWWQCIGDGNGDSTITHLPLVLKEIGKGVDISVAINGAKAATIKTVRASLL